MVRYVRFPNLSLRSTVTTLGVALALALVSAPIVGSAQRPSGGDPSSERERVRAQAANVATQVDALQATDAQVEAALVALERNVAGQQALLAEAKRAAVEAEQAFADATAAVELKTAEIAGLRDQIREFAVDAFVHPPSDDALAALDSDDPGEAAEKRALLEIQNASDADLLDQLRSAEEDLEVQRQLAEAASQRAEEKQAAAGDRLAELTEARDLQSAYAEQVEARLEHSLSEAAALAELDADLSAEIQAEQARAAELARRAAAAAPRPPAGGGGGGGGGGGRAAAAARSTPPSAARPARAAARSPWPARSPARSSRCSTRRPRPGSTCAAAATGPPTDRSRPA